MAITFFDSNSTVGADGLFIPITDLPGVESSDFAGAEPSNKKHSKFLFSLLDQLESNYNTTDLGFSISKLKPTVSGNFINVPFSVSVQSLINLKNNSVETIPVPTTGDNIGIGDFGLDAYLPNATIVTAVDSAGPGALIPLTDLQEYGIVGTPTLGTDDRELLISLFAYIHNNADFAIRNTSVQSAIVVKSVSGEGFVNLNNTAYDDNTHPTTGLLSANKNEQLVLERSYRFILQLGISASTSEINYV